MTVLDPEVDIATAIAAGVAALTIGVNCFAGPVRPVAPDSGVPAKAVFVGMPVVGGIVIPMRETDVGTGPNQIRNHRLQIRLRSEHDDYAGGSALSRLVRDAITYRAPAGYDDITPINPAPMYLGKDEKGHHEWSYNIDALVEETTT